MKRSFLRLVTTGVLGSWAIGFAVLLAYTSTRSWTEERAREDGVFLVYELLSEEPASRRDSRLRELQPHFRVEFSIISADELQRRTDQRPQPRTQLAHRGSPRSAWYYVVFPEGQTVLAAGPVNPALPTGDRFIPIGIILAIVGFPAIAGLIAVRVQRELTKVERASKALAVGELGARVDNERGPSHELAATFNAMAERVEKLIRSRDELVQAVSHELGSPLSRLRFHLELLESKSTQADVARLRAVAEELDALDELVAELLRYAQSDERKLDIRGFNPAQGLADLVELAGLELPEEGTVKVELDPPAEVQIVADQRLFMRAVENLLRNAVRYASHQVRVRVQSIDGAIDVHVDDDGPGIPEAHREQVVAPFFRADADRARKTGGVGLGLAIVSRIVEQHGGALTIAKSPLGGARVTTRWSRGD